MSKEVEQGHRVQWGLHSDSTPHILVAVHGSEAWVRPIYYEGSGQIVPVSELVRIEPEKVTLMPKYRVGEEVRVRGCTFPNTVERISIHYLLSSGLHYEENKVEPVPDVCPACKGTGKQ
ncbi:MAG TPA: hypothetical protein VM537_21670 [Anaerolineae bacterium]|nr:hypothetical protein [Anaerolineae bacterium]